MADGGGGRPPLHLLALAEVSFILSDLDLVRQLSGHGCHVVSHATGLLILP